METSSMRALPAGAETARLEERCLAGEIEEHPSGAADAGAGRGPGAPVRAENCAPGGGQQRAPDGEQSAASGGEGLSNEAVVDHTAMLWKYLPVPADEPESAPEYRNEAAVYPGGRVIAARVRGKKHKHEGTNCDDWYELAHVGDATLAAVSDGAGSKRFSRIGAQASCKAAVGCLAAALGRVLPGGDLRRDLSLDSSDPKWMSACGVVANMVKDAVGKAAGAVEAAYYSRAADPAYERILGRPLEERDFSATLLLAALIPLGGQAGETLAVTCQIGDGAIALLHTGADYENSLKLMGEPDGGAFSGETEFLTSPRTRSVEALQSRTRVYRGHVDLAFLMTDGVADDYFPNDPEMRRLYFDLVLNGVLELKPACSPQAGLTAQQMRLVRRLPEPLAYPWVNDRTKLVALQYTRRICESTGMSLEELWRDRSVLSLAGLLGERAAVGDESLRLRVWLDNYVERGSFDDRTLVIVEM